LNFKRIGFIGAGAMGEAIIKGLLTKGINPENIWISEKSQERSDYLHKEYGIVRAKDNEDLVDHSEAILLAVKPQNLTAAVESFVTSFNNEKILVSILAGVTTAKIEALLPVGSNVVRVMPNTPALIGEGTTVMTGGTNTTDIQLQEVLTIFEAVGRVNVLPETMFNAVTGLSGSGPAFVYLMIEALADGGVLAGLSRDIAYMLAVDTVKGAALMVQETKKHPGQLKDMVTSPAGTTIYGLLQMEKAGLRGTLMETVLAAAKRAEQL
jgi:pyrroline-5-carboxylate reductase